MRIPFLAMLIGLLSCPTLFAADPAPPPSQDSMAVVASSLKWQTGTITLGDGLAKIALPDGYRFLNAADSDKVLHNIWGNPSSPGVMGMIFPPNEGPLDRDSWGVVISYEEEGYVKDDDADKLNYDDLLHQMQQEISKDNDQRVQQGYPSVQLVGWAQPPHYDHATHKLYWAKDVRFGNDPTDTLNYNIRILGRRGVLVLNAVSSMRDLPVVAEKMPEIMSRVDFQPGSTYAEFDPKIDKVAKYGVAALIAGGALGAAAKFGLLKAFWPLLLAFKKLVVVAIVAIAAAAKKVASFFKNKSVVRPFDPSSHAQPAAQPPTPALHPPPTPNNLEALRPPPAPGSGLPPVE
jgi:uncharacterized membrane-anchored protein